MMTNSLKLKEALARDISRQEFLTYIGVGLLSIVGITGLIKNVESMLLSDSGQKVGKKPSYGSSAYGN